MRRSAIFAAAAVAGCAALLALSAYLHSWGGVALVALGAGGLAWYRLQVARSKEEAEQFFGDMGEETRLTGLQPGGASELPADRLNGRPTPPNRDG